MAQVDGFWAGARAVEDAVDLPRLAAAAGGWDALRGMGVDGWVRLGVAPAFAHAWASARPEETLGAPVSLADPRYPAVLRDAPHPPAVLCVEGDPSALSAEGVAIVGTRACTRLGASVARHLGTAFAAAGWTVVSGLARGIDGEAHRGALVSGRTVAVLGHGLAHTAPRRHEGLRRDIVARGGCVVSAWPDALPPRPHTFPRRNAWIAGLSRGVVVVEAPRASGALHTARFALAYGRDIAAVPGPIGAPASEGTNRLLEEGAGVVACVDRFVAAWTGHRAGSRDGWLDAVLAGGSVEAVSRHTGVPVLELLGKLTAAELDGRVVRLPGGRYALAGGGA